MKSSFSSLVRDEKGTSYKPQSLVDLVKNNKTSYGFGAGQSDNAQFRSSMTGLGENRFVRDT